MTATPRHHTPRSDRPTRGPGVAAIAKAKGRNLMPWQRDAVDTALEYDPGTGLYRFGIVVVSVPRQAGKTTLESDVADHRCLTIPRGRVWITMQNGKTVDGWMREEHFSNLAAARAFGVPRTASAKYQLSRRAGEVGVKWPAVGSTFLTFPPKRDALHSKQSDLVFVDEAWAHNAETGADLRQAIRPTMATRKGAQLWVVSTMGDDSSVYLDQYITLARASLGDPSSRVCFIDYGIGDDVDPEDLEAIAADHPAYGHTIDMLALEDAWDEFQSDPQLGGTAGFARAYGNRGTRTRETAIHAAKWTAAARPRVDVPARAGLGIDATPLGDRLAITAAWRHEGESYVEPLWVGTPDRSTPGMILDLMAAKDAPLTVDRAAMGALEIVDAVANLAAERRVEADVRYLTMTEYGSACGMFYRGILDDTVHHFNDADLTASVEVAAKRDLGDGGFGWVRKGSAGSIAEIVSASVALKAFDLLPPPKRRAVARAGKRHH